MKIRCIDCKYIFTCYDQNESKKECFDPKAGKRHGEVIKLGTKNGETIENEN